ncbi:hypothetical protein K5E19_04715, partial [Enterobacter sp. RIT637]|nr:hypothetical protein [Enterobacter sp. RIT637]
MFLFFCFFVFLFSISFTNASDKKDEILSSGDGLESLIDQDANERYDDQFINFKNSQNNLSDSERTKKLLQNQYWLINKNQNFWVGFFDGKQVKVSKGIYPDINIDSYLPQQIIRIKSGGKLSQFVIKSTDVSSYGSPLHCYN